MILKKFKKKIINVLTLACTFCIVMAKSPFCVYIFHELEEPNGIDEWRSKHGK